MQHVNFQWLAVYSYQEKMQTSPFIFTTMGNPTLHFDVQTMDEYLAVFEQPSRPYHYLPAFKFLKSPAILKGISQQNGN